MAHHLIADMSWKGGTPQILFFNMKSKQSDLKLAIVYENLNKKNVRTKGSLLPSSDYLVFSQSHALPFQATHALYFLPRHFPNTFSPLTCGNSFLCKAAVLHKQRSPASQVTQIKTAAHLLCVWKAQFSSSTTRTPQRFPRCSLIGCGVLPACIPELGNNFISVRGNASHCLYRYHCDGH